jgi:ornithine carbamoyltransferase
MKKDFLSVRDFSRKEIEEIFALTGSLKKNSQRYKNALSGKTLALVFQKPSNRTRVSFEVGMYQLGGNSIYLAPHEINLGVRESISDVAKTLSRYTDGIVLRTFAHQNCLELARAASVPVINGLSDFEHPCQALADMFTVREKLSKPGKIIFTYIGDGNNVCNSLLFACANLKIKMRVAAPRGYEPDKAAQKECKAELFRDALQAASGADVLYTDVWASMGQEKEAHKRRKDFRGFQVNARLLEAAHKRCLVMHCLPAHRGEEITADVIDGKNSVVFDQAENRMHVQKAVLIKLLGEW